MCGIFCYLYEDESSFVCNEVNYYNEIESRLRHRGPDLCKRINRKLNDKISAEVIGCTLHLRGSLPVQQPLTSTDGSFLLWNGEIYAGHQIAETENDGEILFKLLMKCEDTQQVLFTLSNILGCWALIFWQASKKLLWFGRDILGRRSLLWMNNFTENSKILALSSVAVRPNKSMCFHHNWTEVPSYGIFVLNLSSENGLDTLKLFPWPHHFDVSSSHNNTTSELSLNWVISKECAPSPIKMSFECSLPNEEEIERCYNELQIQLKPDSSTADFISSIKLSLLANFEKVLTEFQKLMLESVRRRVCNRLNSCKQCIKALNNECFHSKIAILFSGGLDSTVLAVLTHMCLPQDESIDLLNVAFSRQQSTEIDDAPDRLSGLVALEELKKIAPNRKWNLVQINVSKKEMEEQCDANIADLIYPLNTILDKDIGCAIWFAARGQGYIENSQPYACPARVLLTGIGADEQLAGYSRHRLCFRRNGWERLMKELQMEMGRISSRNMGRDDRIIGSHGSEARFPFLDEELVSFLNSLPMHYKANLNLPQGLGDKFLLRLLAFQLGLRSPAFLVKRAIQFGSKIAKMESKQKGNDICVQLNEKIHSLSLN